MAKWPNNPVIYEINTWVWLHELSKKYQSRHYPRKRIPPRNGK